MRDNSFTGTSIAGDDYVEQMTPTEFEETVYKYIAELGQNLPGFKVAHNTRVTGTDGIYQADILASYTELNVNMIVLIECKHYTNPVTREKIQILNDKLRSTGAQKGILFSTSGFQSGAIEYAIRHKIALVRLLTSRFEKVTNTLAKPKRPVYAPPAPRTFIGEFYAADKMSYIGTGKIAELVNYCI
ncbi:restriction endonuclease [Mucilaginibacter sp.]|uniref:restriction endonuclease n=1 Tax=Mucilaginibacter sp. TaxID=1882438 RepID=UPI0025CD2AAF|nr:restriction endonuclease [Mucilaginibacter sp.]